MVLRGTCCADVLAVLAPQPTTPKPEEFSPDARQRSSPTGENLAGFQFLWNSFFITLRGANSETCLHVVKRKFINRGVSVSADLDVILPLDLLLSDNRFSKIVEEESSMTHQKAAGTPSLQVEN